MAELSSAALGRSALDRLHTASTQERGTAVHAGLVAEAQAFATLAVVAAINETQWDRGESTSRLLSRILQSTGA